MLSKLSISNYALIDSLEIDLSNGFTIITGETGAGKSILLGAIALLSGQRGGLQVLREKSKKCVIEGVFFIKNYGLENFFKENDLDYLEESTIRRELTPAGSSRAFINDTPVNLSQLKELGFHLIDIHSQHQTLLLNQKDFQLAILDSFAKNKVLLVNYLKHFKELKTLNRELNELKEKREKESREQDYLKFLCEELEKANLESGELEKKETELKTLENAEEIKTELISSAQILGEGEVNILSSLNEVRTRVSNASAFFSELTEIKDRLQSVYLELKDISEEISDLEENIHFDKNKIAALTERLDLLNSLIRKHQVKELDELINKKDLLSRSLDLFESIDKSIESLTSRIAALKSEVVLLANKLSESRKKAIPLIESFIQKFCTNIGMPDVKFLITSQLLEEGEFGESGRDKISFLFSANKGSEPKEIIKSASGGELSRIMLAIKALIADASLLPTIVFDEIDTGISGDVSDRVGEVLLKMADSRQVIAITHQPQIAGKGINHLFVHKELVKNTTLTRIRALNREERILEIAKMLSNDNPTKAALNTAKELLKN